MIVIGNSSFAKGMLLAGIKNSHVFVSRQKTLELMKNIRGDDLIIVNSSVLAEVPELKSFKNLVVMPDLLKDFSRIDDLQSTVKKVVGMELEV